MFLIYFFDKKTYNRCQNRTPKAWQYNGHSYK